MRKILVSGYYGFDNAGDEAILEAIITWLSENLGIDKKEVVVLSQRPEKTAQRYGVSAVKRDSLSQLVRSMRKARLFISGGGSLLQDATGPKSIPYYVGLMRMARLFGVPVAFFAQGVGPVRLGFNRSLVRKVLEKVDHLSVRDAASWELLQELGVARDIHLTADAVFTLQPCGAERVEEILQGEGIYPPIISEGVPGQAASTGREPSHAESVHAEPAAGAKALDSKQTPLIGVSVRPWGDNKYLKELEKSLRFLSDQAGAKILFLPLHHGDDLPVCREMRKNLGKRALLLAGDYPPRELLGLVGALDFLIGVRLHALIFAGLMGVPFVGISYDPKVKSFLKKCHTPVLATTEDLDFAEFGSAVSELYANRDALARGQRQGVEELTKQAEQGFSRLAELLQGG